MKTFTVNFDVVLICKFEMEIEASSPEAAKNKIRKMAKKGEIDPADSDTYWADSEPDNFSVQRYL